MNRMFNLIAILLLLVPVLSAPILAMVLMKAIGRADLRAAGPALGMPTEVNAGLARATADETAFTMGQAVA
jgi:hypothetical protein